MLDQIDECVLAPLDVVEDDHQRPLRGDVFQGLADGPRDLLHGGRRRQSRPAASGSRPSPPHPEAAARTTRSASSSRTVGTPNTSMTASPMNFSTLPP